MYYKLNSSQENYLIHQPETGMGYQIVEAKRNGSYVREKFIVLNCEIIIEINGNQGFFIGMFMKKERVYPSLSADFISITSSIVLNEFQFRNIFNETKVNSDSGAINNAVENANGTEIFVRLSAFDDDKRIDKITKRLLPGSFTTMMDDYLACKASNDDPIERYALPSSEIIIFAFHIQPIKSDTLQRGIVQPANGKRGNGKEVYFAYGTGPGTFLKQTPY